MTTGELMDARGRPLRDLRLSVTDRCNFRCRYCLPRETTGPLAFLPRSHLLSFEELEQLIFAFVSLGVQKVRITGGEPLLRRGLPELIARLSRAGVELALTTNGVLLPGLAAQLAKAGLNRVTVSLDALDPDVFNAICDAPGFGPDDVLRGIESAALAGLGPIKINCVVKRSVNLHQVLPLVRRFRHSGHELRFIEYMDVGTLNDWRPSEVVPSEELRDLISSEAPLVSLVRSAPSDVAEVFQMSGLRVGFISSVSSPFCGGCTRARVTADGKLYTCLFGSESYDLRAILRDPKLEPSPFGDGHPEPQDVATQRRAPVQRRLREELTRVWSGRADRYSEERPLSAKSRLPLVGSSRVEMARIGG